MGEDWLTFLFIYLLGGVTFIPLLLCGVFVHAYLTFPYRIDADTALDDAASTLLQPGDDIEAVDAARKAHREELQSQSQSRPRLDHGSDVAAGYFAVCREYIPMGINAKPIERATPVGSATVASPSPSVYQTMYRSIFERKQTAGPLDNKNTPNQRPKKAGNVFYVVLRHGHLMLFDDDEQLEVRHVISLAHHDISIYSGGDLTPEGELFIKRNALCLSRRKHAPEMTPDSQLSKPFYLFSENCSAKEDFYFALLRNQEQTFGTDRKSPVPLQFDVKDIITLVQRLHSSDEHVHTRWLNGLLGRVFLGVHRTPDLENFIREKITKKISRVKLPSFLSGIAIRRIYTGESAPYVTNPRLRDLTVEGECVAEADIRYTGNFRIEVAATARIDLGARFKVREVNLVLAVVVRKVEGHVLFKIKPPPSNRVWFSYQAMPKMEMTIEPIVSSRQITYTLILRQIENRIKEVIAESVVHPFWDDVPFFRTEHKKWRGGIWEADDAMVSLDHAEATAGQEGDIDDRLEELSGSSIDMPPMEKSHSLPVLENTPSAALFGRKLSAKPTSSTRPSATTTSFDSKSAAPTVPRSMRSGSTVAAPVVATDASHADVFKPSMSPPDHAVSAMATLSAKSESASPSRTTATPESLTKRPPVFKRANNSSSSIDAMDAVSDSERTPTGQGHVGKGSSSDSAPRDGNVNAVPPSHVGKGILQSQTGSLARGFFRRETSSNSASSASTNNDSTSKRNTLAVVTSAAAQAKNWGWNALQRQKDQAKPGSASQSSSAVDLNQPMGRGQPLPPPGMPLPLPDKRSRLAPITMPRRRPVPPPPLPQRPVTAEVADDHADSCPASPPPLPKRRQPDQQADGGDENNNVLIVAAPLEESEPGTPSDEAPLAFSTPWTEETSLAEHPDQDSLLDGLEHAGGEHSLSPITAIPVSVEDEDEDDDDGYSGWIDNTGLDDTADAVEAGVDTAADT